MPSISSRVMTMREREDELALFLEMRKREKEKTDDLLFLQDSDEFNETLVSQPGSSPLFDIPTTVPARKPAAADFLNEESEKNDYDWLLTPPGTPLFPSLEMESRKAYMNGVEASKPQPTVLRSRLGNSQTETAVKCSLVPKQPSASAGLTSLASGMRRPSSCSGGPGSRPVTPGGAGSRPVTPTVRSSLASSKSSRPSTPTSRATLASAKPTARSASSKPTTSLTSTWSTTSTVSSRSAVPSRSSTPTRTTARPSASSSGPSRSSAALSGPSRPSAPSNGPSRSPTPLRSTARSSMPTRSTARSSTPTSRPTVLASRSTLAASRPTVPASCPTSRSTTPNRRPSAPSSVAAASAALNRSSSSVSSKSGSAAPSKNPPPSRVGSPTVRSRPWNPSEMPGFSLDAPPNLRTTLPDRPLSATRGRPAAPSMRSASIEPVTNGRPRRQSCSPLRAGASNGHSSGSSVPAVNRGHSKVSDDISPVVIGNKMVERVVNMRKLAPPRQDGKHSPSLSGKSASSPDSSGFGRTLSKKSLDMAIRHMDIRRTIPGNLRPLMTKIPASSMYSVRSGPAGSRTASVSDSPLATSSNASSDLSFNNHAAAIDGHGSEVDDDIASDRGVQPSPISLHGR